MESEEKNFDIITKARQGDLSKEELDLLIECNKSINEALDNFEKRLRGEK